MSDLISRSALINKIRGIVPSSQDVDFIVRLIEEQPTAYDIEKVVTELEEWTYIADVVMPRGDIVKNVKLISSGNAIDIVRKGGVE